MVQNSILLSVATLAVLLIGVDSSICNEKCGHGNLAPRDKCRVKLGTWLQCSPDHNGICPAGTIYCGAPPPTPKPNPTPTPDDDESGSGESPELQTESPILLIESPQSPNACEVDINSISCIVLCDSQEDRADWCPQVPSTTATPINIFPNFKQGGVLTVDDDNDIKFTALDDSVEKNEKVQKAKKDLEDAMKKAKPIKKKLDKIKKALKDEKTKVAKEYKTKIADIQDKIDAAIGNGNLSTLSLLYNNVTSLNTNLTSIRSEYMSINNISSVRSLIMQLRAAQAEHNAALMNVTSSANAYTSAVEDVQETESTSSSSATMDQSTVIGLAVFGVVVFITVGVLFGVAITRQMQKSPTVNDTKYQQSVRSVTIATNPTYEPSVALDTPIYDTPKGYGNDQVTYAVAGTPA